MAFSLAVDDNALLRYHVPVKSMKRREFLKMIEAAGWSLIRHGGDHDIYGRRQETFSVPRHTEIQAGIIRQWERKDRKAEEEEGP